LITLSTGGGGFPFPFTVVEAILLESPNYLSCGQNVFFSLVIGRLARVSCGAAAAAAAAWRTAACSVQQQLQLRLLGGVEVRRRERGRGTAELSPDLDSPIHQIW